MLVLLFKVNFAQNVKSMDKMSYPYTANYSSDFKMGNPAHAKMILELWKDWDDNAFDRHNYFADTGFLFFRGGGGRGKGFGLGGAKKVGERHQKPHQVRLMQGGWEGVGGKGVGGGGGGEKKRPFWMVKQTKRTYRSPAV